MADFRDYLELEIGLSSRLASVWRPYAAEVYAKITEAVAAKDWATAHDIANSIDLTDLLAPQKDYIRAVLKTCAIHGANMAAGQASMISSLDFSRTLDRVVDVFMTSIEFNTSRTIADHAAQLIAAAQAEATVVVYKAQTRFVKEFVSFQQNGDAALQLVSSLNTNRLATWGFTAEADLLGYTEYELSAILDGRTSAFCRAINGKKFKVVDARASIVNVLAADTPGDAKTLQPWPKQTKDAIADFKEMTPAELTALGLHIPPFHPNCRTMLVRIGQAPKLNKPSKPNPSDALPEYHATEDSFKAVGLDVAPDKIDHWNTYVHLNPVDVLSELSGLTPKDIADGQLGTRYRTIDFKDNGDIGFKFRAPVGVKGSANSRLTFNPYTGTLYKDYQDYKAASQVDAQVFFRRFDQSLAQVGKSLAADKLVVAVGAGQAVAYGRMGYLPSPDDWIEVRNNMVKGLEDQANAVQLDGMSAQQRELINLLLTSKDERSFRALVDLNYAEPLMSDLLEDAQFEAVLDLVDPAVLKKHGDAA